MNCAKCFETWPAGNPDYEITRPMRLLRIGEVGDYDQFKCPNCHAKFFFPKDAELRRVKITNGRYAGKFGMAESYYDRLTPVTVDGNRIPMSRRDFVDAPLRELPPLQRMEIRIAHRHKVAAQLFRFTYSRLRVRRAIKNPARTPFDELSEESQAAWLDLADFVLMRGTHSHRDWK